MENNLFLPRYIFENLLELHLEVRARQVEFFANLL